MYSSPPATAGRLFGHAPKPQSPAAQGKIQNDEATGDEAVPKGTLRLPLIDNGHLLAATSYLQMKAARPFHAVCRVRGPGSQDRRLLAL